MVGLMVTSSKRVYAIPRFAVLRASAPAAGHERPNPPLESPGHSWTSLGQSLTDPMNSKKGKKDRTLKDKLSRSVGTQCATGEQWRNNSRKNEMIEPKQKQYPILGVTGDRRNVQ